jgi:glycerol-3-phosphate dehydrogenase (NAD(P)+)
MRATVVGAGSWGTAFAAHLAKRGMEVVIWARENEVVEGINRERRNPLFLSQNTLPNGLLATGDLAEAVRGSELVVMAVPSRWAGEVASSLSSCLGDGVMVLNLAKGFHPGTHERLSTVIAREASLSPGQVAVLSGPNHAEEVIQEIPSATVIACSDPSKARMLQERVSSPYFRVYTNRDVCGVEVGAACKNVLAIAAGVVDGMGLGDNTKASLVTRGLSEIMRFGVALGAMPTTFSGLSGIGDIMVTCYSRHSRNRGLGEKLGRGMSLEEATRGSRMVVEGVYATDIMLSLAEKLGVEAPVATAVQGIIRGAMSPREALQSLMGRKLKEETEEESVLFMQAHNDKGGPGD